MSRQETLKGPPLRSLGGSPWANRSAPLGVVPGQRDLENGIWSKPSFRSPRRGDPPGPEGWSVRIQVHRYSPYGRATSISSLQSFPPRFACSWIRPFYRRVGLHAPCFVDALMRSFPRQTSLKCSDRCPPTHRHSTAQALCSGVTIPSWGTDRKTVMSSTLGTS